MGKLRITATSWLPSAPLHQLDENNHDGERNGEGDSDADKCGENEWCSMVRAAVDRHLAGSVIGQHVDADPPDFAGAGC